MSPFFQVSRPHLRNLFFRTSALLLLGAHPVFVMDGAAPEMKRETMSARRQAEASQQQSQLSQQQSQVKSLSRSRLKALMNECRFLLKSLGLECLQAEGEAEALCALLNRRGKVDAVVTEDSDTFCHGATSVLRGFSVKAGGVTAERFQDQRLRQGSEWE